MPRRKAPQKSTRKRRTAQPARRPNPPRKALVPRGGYRGVPNVYNFVRETRPTTIDIGNAATPGVSLIAGTGAIPDISVFEFPNFSIDQLAGGFTEFSDLFANYKIRKIEAVLIPMWNTQVQQSVNPQTGVWSNTGYIPNLMVTRVNTKYLPNGYVVPATAEANRDQLAQINKKTRSLYGTKKWLKITTQTPRVNMKIEDGAGGTNIVSTSTPWLPTVQAADQEYAMNDLIFADKLDGQNFSAGIYQYRMFLRCHFSCSFVG